MTAGQKPKPVESEAKVETTQDPSAEQGAAEEVAKPGVPEARIPDAVVETTVVPEPSVPRLTAEQGPQKPYVIQVATYAIDRDAVSLAKQMQDVGVPAFVRTLTRGDTGKMFYCVFLGWFTNYTEAEENLQRFKKHEVAGPFQDAFVRSLRA